MNTARHIKTIILLFALMMGVTSEAWAQESPTLSKANIIIDGGTRVGETDEYTIDHGSVTITSVNSETRTVTLTVTPSAGYYIQMSDILVQKLADPANASAPRRVPDIADLLVVSGPVKSKEAAEYTFVVPVDYVGALVSVTFRQLAAAKVTVKPNALVYTGSAQELVTLGEVTGASFDNGIVLDENTSLEGYYSKSGDVYSACNADDMADGTTTYYKPLVTYSDTENGTYSATIPKGTDAGTYTVYYKYVADGNHADGGGSVTVVINKAPITSVTLQEYVKKHTGNAITFSITSVKAGDVTVSSSEYNVSGDALTQTAVDSYTYTVTAKPTSTNFTGSASVHFRIVENTIVFIPDDNSSPSDMAGKYVLTADISASVLAGLYSTTTDFTGELDGNFHKITGLSGHGLFNTINDGTVKNVMLDDVTISGGTNVGAIANEAKGDSRIYNCGILPSNTNYDNKGNITGFSGSSISGTGNVGSLVGKLDGTARVINCFSYANVSGGDLVGGIVGKNNVATTSSNLGTMVMNCIFYGDITGGASKAPIYNGTIITNDGDANGVNNFNYFWSGASYVDNKNIDVYHCALSAETRFLQRFEFFRHLLNSNRELAAWWVKGSDGKKIDMGKWVLEPSQIGNNVPFPILKAHGYYPSVVNYAPGEISYDEANRNKGRKLTSEGDGGVLHVTISMGSGGAQFGPPTGAGLKPGQSATFDLTITDKDYEHFNFNYGKVQLPYYNDYCVGNYTGNRVVTGWKIVSMSKSAGSFTTGADAAATVNDDGDITLTTPYNFADRKSTVKDIYSDTNKRVFNQGAYFDVPEGVTSITIEPYWGKAVYLADSYWDVTYKNGTGSDKNKAGHTSDAMTTAANVPNVGGGEEGKEGQRYVNGSKYNLATHSLDENGQVVFTSMSNAISSKNNGLFTGGDANSHTVFDYAVVLVGNYHHIDAIEASKSKPYTVTSIDLDGDNEPDYSFMLRFNGRTMVHPVRYDFLNLIGLGMAQKTTGGQGSYNLGIMQPKAWFEVTNTALLRVTQFEYDRTEEGKEANTRSEAPYILQGGVFEQWVSGQGNGVSNNTIYFHVGGNVWFKEFQLGTHIDQTWSCKHPPISVTGGDYNEFYLTGLYRGDVTSFNDDAECYINGGRFGILAGAGQEGLGDATNHTNGNITWQIDNADIKEFYGGGFNQPIQGNITTVISNSRVEQFCGGPKFGDMYNEKTVKTKATKCTFGTYFGAGFGGNAYGRRAPTNKNNITGDYTKTNWDKFVNDEYKQEYSSNNKYKGVSTKYDYQYLPMSNNTQNVARIFIDYVRFSLATTHGVTSQLTDCHITGNFYGGGSLGKVDGSVSSTLNSCTVDGSAFGAGYSASTPTVDVMNTGGFTTAPYYDDNLGAYFEPDFPSSVPYTWAHSDVTVNSTANAIDKTNHILYTNENLTTLGTVTGDATLTIAGTTTVGGSVYGGGEESGVEGNTVVTVNNGTIGTIGKGGATHGNVYGGGKGKAKNEEGETFDDLSLVKMGLVKGNTNVTISGGSILHNVYGGGAFGSVGDFNYDASGNITSQKTADTGTANVTITGGTIGTTGESNGMVFGSSRGDVDAPGEIQDRLAWVHDTHVVIGTAGQGFDAPQPQIKGSVYGSGENGHTYNDAEVIIHSGTIGIASGVKVTDDSGNEYEGAAYPYRGNVYGGGCGTDTYPEKYDSDGDDDIDEDDDVRDAFNPLAGIVRGDATVNIDGGHVVRNVYGAGAMGSVGTTDVTASGHTTINISGGTIGVDGTAGEGNVFGAARGSAEATSNEYALVRNTTTVNISGSSNVHGSVYGGGELGCVGRYKFTNDMRNFYWTDTPLASIDPENLTYNNTGVCNVNISGGTIGTHVFGGGKGKEDTFWCEKGIANKTNVSITDGTVNGNVYGGGQVGRVETDATVKVGPDEGIGSPVVKGNVFGAGAGLKTHGYAALVRGNTNVTIQSSAKVGKSVYGGGEIASVGKYKIKEDDGVPDDAPDWVLVGMPYSLRNNGSGKCTVVIKDNAEIGPDNMVMHNTTTGKPDDSGHVIGACMGVLPYEGVEGGENGDPWRMVPGNTEEHFTAAYYAEHSETYSGKDYKADYFKFIESLALATETDVTISGNAFVKGSVYGGSLNGHVQHDTKVTIEGGQIGAGAGMTEPYKETDWAGTSTPSGGWKACATWSYVDNGAPYDPYAKYSKTVDGKTKYYYNEGCTDSAEDGATVATDGHTYYGNVFGGGSGVIPYAPGKWHRGAGSVDGNTVVNITGGHILTNVYGGNEQTDVGTYTKDSNGLSTATEVSDNPKGKCTINMTGGTVGVPRTDEAIKLLPTIGHVYGGGKGDKRIFFNTWTNVVETEVNITGNARIYGSTFGGGEDGHVLNNAKTTIGGSVTIGGTSSSHSNVIIGATGTSGFDGDVFGGGQGSVTALTAGVVGGNVELNIQNGTVLGSVYGGGRIASVGTFFASPTDPLYGKMQEGDDHGNIKVNLTGGTISQNVFGGGMGTTDNTYGTRDGLAISKNVTVELNNGVAEDAKGCIVKGYIFGCNNVNSTPQGHAKVHIHATQNKDEATLLDKNDVYDVKGVFGGGNRADYVPAESDTEQSTEVIIEGCNLTSIEEVYGGGYGAAVPGTYVLVKGTKIIDNVFGGGYGAGNHTDPTATDYNPGANVGFLTDGTTSYGLHVGEVDSEGKEYKTVFVRLMAGKINNVYGGSNTKGNIRGGSSVKNTDNDGSEGCCDKLEVGKIFGGGKSAAMYGGAEVVLGCMPNDWIEEIYAGADQADVGNDVSLTITSGKFGRVFGGNNTSGTISGSIEVNIEENPNCGTPIIIGELYGGGNQAPYTVPQDYIDDWKTQYGEDADYPSPRVNVRSFTSIGNIYGGGLGETAIVTGNPTVNINEVIVTDNNDTNHAFNPADTDAGRPTFIDGMNVKLYSHDAGKMGVIGNVFGGGNAAQVVGNTYLNIGTETTQTFISIEGDSAVKTVNGADIRGNVYGGGNQAEVTGNTNVNIGKKVE